MSTNCKKKEGNVESTTIPEELKCALTNKLMTEPVIAFDDFTYEKTDIWEYLQTHGKSPQTGKKMPIGYEIDDMEINYEILKKIKQFHQQS